jgi:hypothetical protein
VDRGLLLAELLLEEYSLIKRKPIGASWAWFSRPFVLEWLPSHLGLVGAHLSASPSRCHLSQSHSQFVVAAHGLVYINHMPVWV